MSKEKSVRTGKNGPHIGAERGRLFSQDTQRQGFVLGDPRQSPNHSENSLFFSYSKDTISPSNNMDPCPSFSQDSHAQKINVKQDAFLDKGELCKH